MLLFLKQRTYRSLEAFVLIQSILQQSLTVSAEKSGFGGLISFLTSSATRKQHRDSYAPATYQALTVIRSAALEGHNLSVLNRRKRVCRSM